MHFTSQNLPVLAMVAVLLLVACQQETAPIPSPMDDNEILASPGKIHNEMISYYYAFRTGPHDSHEEVIVKRSPSLLRI